MFEILPSFGVTDGSRGAQIYNFSKFINFSKKVFCHEHFFHSTPGLTFLVLHCVMTIWNTIFTLIFYNNFFWNKIVCLNFFSITDSFIWIKWLIMTIILLHVFSSHKILTFASFDSLCFLLFWRENMKSNAAQLERSLISDWRSM